jgi:hypothetical protein
MRDQSVEVGGDHATQALTIAILRGSGILPECGIQRTHQAREKHDLPHGYFFPSLPM